MKEWNGDYQGLGGESKGELLIKGHKVSVKQDVSALAICCTQLYL